MHMFSNLNLILSVKLISGNYGVRNSIYADDVFIPNLGSSGVTSDLSYDMTSARMSGE